MASIEVKNTSFDVIKGIADNLLSRTGVRPKVGIICGSGLGSLADYVAESEPIEYSSIPGFPVSTVEGHAGRLIFGKIESMPVVLMQGRFHFYEGYPLDKVTLPVRVMKLMGVEYLLVTNAAGGLNPTFKIGDIMLIYDHINWPGFAGNSPLRGPNESRFGVRFPPVIDAYDRGLIDKAKEVAAKMGISEYMHEGVYACIGGPTYETIAELKLLHKLGADTVGMSTAHEVVTARHCGMTVLAFSLVTDKSPLDYKSTDRVKHEEVVNVAKQRQTTCGELVRGILKEIAATSMASSDR